MIKQPLTIEHALLGFLSQQPMHAYEIHQTLLRNEALGLVWHIKQSLIYVMLERLEAEGFITTSIEPQGSRPPRKMLSLTSAGQAAFDGWLTTPVEHGRDFRQEFLAKLFFAQAAGPAMVAALIAVQQRTCHAWLDDLQTRLGAIGPERPYDRLVVQFRIGQIDAIVIWLGLCMETLALPTTV